MPPSFATTPCAEPDVLFPSVLIGVRSRWAAIFQRQSGGLFENVAVEALIDDQATTAGIEAALTESLASRVKPPDVFVLHVSGHGFTIGDRYYFLPQDFVNDQESVEASIQKHGIAADEFGD